MKVGDLVKSIKNENQEYGSIGIVTQFETHYGLRGRDGEAGWWVLFAGENNPLWNFECDLEVVNESR